MRISTQWQLAPFAIRDGVQSITRYPCSLRVGAAGRLRRGRPGISKSVSADMRRSVLTRPLNAGTLYSHGYSGIGGSSDFMNYNYPAPAPRPLFGDFDWMGHLIPQAEVPTVGFGLVLSSSNCMLPSAPEPVESDYADMKFAHGEA